MDQLHIIFSCLRSCSDFLSSAFYHTSCTVIHQGLLLICRHADFKQHFVRQRKKAAPSHEVFVRTLCLPELKFRQFLKSFSHIRSLWQNISGQAGTHQLTKNRSSTLSVLLRFFAPSFTFQRLFFQHLEKRTAVSTCAHRGNRSKQCAFCARYPFPRSRAASRASVAGSHDT